MRSLVSAACITLLTMAFVVESSAASKVAAGKLLREPCDLAQLIGHYIPTCEYLRVGQCFSPDFGGLLESINVPLSVLGTEDLEVQFYAAEMGMPATLLGAASVPASAAVPGTGRSGRPLVTIDFESLGILLDADAEYVFVLGTGPATTYHTSWAVRDSYAGGRAYVSRSNGPWHDLFLPDSDISFQVVVKKHSAVFAEPSTWGAVKSLLGARR